MAIVGFLQQRLVELEDLLGRQSRLGGDGPQAAADIVGVPGLPQLRELLRI
ncbi:hypothetical protein [Streptomyces sp. V4I2]|uniref:hypothetical protein n=1 Tax=Streptomyces sp. V4I2 TaxID=3042280 RepID=UPI002782DB80|nr:hypothetical protein [Streptomyces sp. V4I2]MDQ1052027.1 hypothetical protein [Streptomyces sp. V4I2]